MKWVEKVETSLSETAFSENRLKRPENYLSGGYSAGYTTSSLLSITVFNIFLSLTLILLALPVMFCICVVLKFRDPAGPLLYSGTRLGRNMKPFLMFKFRTLPEGSQKIIGGKTLAATDDLVSPFTRFLRDTRLDELPQLFNIFKGDMDFIGPRPVRPEIYETLCQAIPNYELRFLVKPGLIGYAQLFTPHSSPKKIRSRLDNKHIFIRRSLMSDILIISYTILVTLWQVVVSATVLLQDVINSKLLKRYSNKRVLIRVRPKSAFLYVDSLKVEMTVCDQNEDCVRVASSHELAEQQEFNFTLSIKTFRFGRRRRKKAHCWGKRMKTTLISTEPPVYEHVICYAPVSPFNHYLIHQYFLHESIA